MAHRTRGLAARYRSSGLTQSQFCKNQSVSLSTLHYHLRRDRNASPLPLATSPGFVPLTVLPSNLPERTIVMIRGRFSVAELSQLLNGSGE